MRARCSTAEGMNHRCAVETDEHCSSVRVYIFYITIDQCQEPSWKIIHLHFPQNIHNTTTSPIKTTKPSLQSPSQDPTSSISNPPILSLQHPLPRKHLDPLRPPLPFTFPLLQPPPYPPNAAACSSLSARSLPSCARTRRSSRRHRRRCAFWCRYGM